MKSLTLAVLLIAGSSFAEDDPVAPVPPPPPVPPPAVIVEPPAPPPATVIVPVPAPQPEREYHYIVPEKPAPVIVPVAVEKKPLGLGFNVGGGVTQYFADEARSAADVGPEWNARILVGSRSWFAGEAAYVGNTQQVSGLSANLRGPQLMSHGVEGLFRFNMTRADLQPFIGAGLGYRHYNVINATTTALSDVSDDVNMGYVPTAAGLSYRVNGLMVDGRFGVDIPFTTPAIRTVRNEAAATSWNLGANIGWEF